jgi:hypothetical protein
MGRTMVHDTRLWRKSSAVVQPCMQRKNSAPGGFMKVLPRQEADLGGGALQFVVPQFEM